MTIPNTSGQPNFGKAGGRRRHARRRPTLLTGRRKSQSIEFISKKKYNTYTLNYLKVGIR
jgi:hypothetical protein